MKKRGSLTHRYWETLCFVIELEKVYGNPEIDTKKRTRELAEVTDKFIKSISQDHKY